MKHLTNNLPLVSIIIVNFNGKKHLEKCLESLLKIYYSNYEIIIIDNNSTDGSIEFLEKNYPHIILKKLEKNYGFAQPNNLGAKLAKGKLLLFLNNDVSVTPNFLNELVKSIISNEKIAICQSLLLKSNNEIDSSGDFIGNDGIPFSSKFVYSEPTEILSPRGASFIMKNSLFFSLGKFDETFFASFEDIDLGIRTWLAGNTVLVIPKSIVFHLGGATISKNKIFFQFHGTKNLLTIFFTYFDFFTLSKIFGTNLLLLFKFFFKIKTSNFTHKTTFPSFKIILKSLWWVITNWRYIKDKKMKINNNKKITIRSLIEKKLIFKSKL
ncbi:glycosyltransferase family 2 protein [Nitrosopumilus sp.]|uniref:glycosyltransferase family 2 protein n=1 Tax=Nitrosopumilus sp. TaxID=2024843 RepID=UPI002930B412|nr:glycosyltransferase family 2 protein [Nitrosopumilus sp.]